MIFKKLYIIAGLGVLIPNTKQDVKNIRHKENGILSGVNEIADYGRKGPRDSVGKANI